MFGKKVGANSHHDNFTRSQESPGSDYVIPDVSRSQQYPVSDYVLPDVRWWKESSEYVDTKDVVVVPEKDWTCSTCSWKADPTDLTCRNISYASRGLRFEDVRDAT